MRELEKHEVKKRGCDYCVELECHRTEKKYATSSYFVMAKYCPHEQCPYTELDAYATYDEYLEHEKNVKIRRKRKKVVDNTL